MRHLYGAALAVVLVAVMFFAGAWGYLQLLKLPVAPGQASALPAGGGSLLSNSTALLALAAVAGTALLAGLFIMVRWFSPLAAGLPGLLLLAWTGLYLASVRQAVRFIPLRSDAFGAGWEALLFNGILAALGVVLVFPLFVPSRWRTRRQRDEADTFTQEADEFLFGVPASDAQGGKGRKHGKASRPDRAPALVGTVMPRDSGSFPRASADSGPMTRVDTTRVTGASRVLRTTGSFQAATGGVPGYSPWQDVDRPGYDQGYGDDRDY